MAAWLGALAQLGGNILGGQAAGASEAAKLRLLEEARGDLRGIPLPLLKELLGEELGPSELSSIESDPSLKMAEMEALERLSQIANQGGLSMADRAKLNEIQNSLGQGENQRQQTLASQMAARGQLDSGAQLAMSLASQQQAANRGAKFGGDVAADAEDRALQAILERGRMAGNMRSKDFGEKTVKAQAKDDLAKWNAANRERSKYYNAGLPQQQFANQVSKATGSQAATNNLASYYGNQADAARAQYANYGRAAGAAVDNLFDSEDDE